MFEGVRPRSDESQSFTYSEGRAGIVSGKEYITRSPNKAQRKGRGGAGSRLIRREIKTGCREEGEGEGRWKKKSGDMPRRVK